MAQIDWSKRQDGLGKEWTVTDDKGNVLEQGRDKTEKLPDGTIKHHSVDEVTKESHGWEYKPGEGVKKQW